VPCEDEIVASVASFLPDSRVVSAQDADMPVNWDRGLMAADHEQPPSMRQTRAVVVDPSPAAAHHRGANAVDADAAVVVPTNRKHRRDVLDAANQLAQFDQLRGMVYEIAP